MKLILRVLLSILVLLFICPAPGFSMGAAQEFTYVPGFPNSATIRAIMLDSQGYVWMGSDNFVYRYDGVQTIPFPLDAHSPDRVIMATSLAETPEGLIVVGTDSGLYLIGATPGGAADIRQILTDKVKNVSDLAFHPGGNLVIATPETLWSYSFEGNSLTPMRVVREPLSLANKPCAIVLSKEGVVMVARDGGIYEFGRNMQVRRIKNPDAINQRETIPRFSKGTYLGEDLYLATDSHGLWRVAPSGSTSRIEDVDANVITSLAAVGDSTLYVGTDGGGVYEWNAARQSVEHRYMHAPGVSGSLESNQIYSLMVDAENRLWVGHYQRGVDFTPSRHSGIKLIGVDSEDGAARTINILPDGVMAVGSRAGLYFFSKEVSNEGSHIIRKVSRPALRSNMVISTAVEGDIIYVGTYGGGMSAINVKTGRPAPGHNPLPASMDAAHVFSIAIEPASGELWIGTSAGLYHAARGSLQHFTSENSPLPKGNVYTVFFDSSGKGWIATEEGLAIWDPEMKKLRTDCFPENFISKAKVRQIFEGKNRTLYFVLENGKIAVCSLDMRNFERPDVLNHRNYTVKAVAEDRSGNVWLATNYGLLMWDRTARLMVFGKDDGVPSTPFIHCVPARIGDTILFGNSSGLVEVDCKTLLARNHHPGLIPSYIVAGDAAVHKFNNTKSDDDDGNRNEYRVRFDQYHSSIVVKFTTMRYEGSDNSKYEYRVGDGEWLPLSADFSVSIHDVARGNTKISVRPLDDDSALTTLIVEMPRDYRFVIWIAVLVILTTGGAVGFGYFHSRRLGKETPDDFTLNYHPAVENLKSSGGDHDSDKAKYATISLSRRESMEILAKVDRIIKHDKPYTNPDLKVADLARMANVTAHKLSYVLTQHRNVGFYDFINHYRIEEFKRIVESGEAELLTLTAMSEKAGFSSRSTFFRYFKKHEGLTPGEYLKQHGRS